MKKIGILCALLVALLLLGGADWPISKETKDIGAITLRGAKLSMRMRSEDAKGIPDMTLGTVEITVRTNTRLLRFTGLVVQDCRQSDWGYGCDQITLQIW